MADTLTPAVEALEAAVDAAVERSHTERDALNAQIVALQAQVAAGGMSADEEAAIAGRIALLKAKVDAIDPTSPTTLTEES